MDKKLCLNFQPLPKYYSASRELRNQAEKQRRDRLNHYVSELASLVPFVATSQKKVDKISILRLAASYLRMNQILQSKETEKWSLLANINRSSFSELLNSIGGFILVTTTNGKIVYTSEAIGEIFGYSQADVLGQSFYCLLRDEDRDLVQKELEVKESNETYRRSFHCRMVSKCPSKHDEKPFEIVHIVGRLKPMTYHSNCLQIRPHRSSFRRRSGSSCSNKGPEVKLETEENFETKTINNQPYIFISFVQVMKALPITEIYTLDSMKDQYITKHDKSGIIVHIDHRMSCILGYMPGEVYKRSAYEFIHLDDALWAIVLQIEMFAKGEGYVTYRIKCTNDTYVSLSSKGFTERNNSVDGFVCVNTLISIKEAKEEMKKERLSVIPFLKSLQLNILIQAIQQISMDPKTIESIVIKAEKIKSNIDKLSLEDIISQNILDLPVSNNKHPQPDSTSSEPHKRRKKNNSNHPSENKEEKRKMTNYLSPDSPNCPVNSSCELIAPKTTRTNDNNASFLVSNTFNQMYMSPSSSSNSSSTDTYGGIEVAAPPHSPFSGYSFSKNYVPQRSPFTRERSSPQNSFHIDLTKNYSNSFSQFNFSRQLCSTSRFSDPCLLFNSFESGFDHSIK